jgi:hypothetical protein
MMQMQAVSRAEGIALLENKGVQDQGACEVCTHDQSKQPAMFRSLMFIPRL